MEHLLLSEDASTVLIPYMPSAAYDGGDFQTFAARKGWDVTTWKWSTLEQGFDTNGKSMSEMAAFLQHWLFFGLLTAVLGVPVPIDHFVRAHADNQRYICTAALARYLHDWRAVVETLDEQEKEAKADHAEDCLLEANGINQMLTYLLFYGSLVAKSEVLEQTIFAQTLLAEALSAARDLIFYSQCPTQRSCIDVHLRTQMARAGWCAVTIEYLQDKLSLSAQTLAFSLGSARTKEDHSKCVGDPAIECQVGRVSSSYRVKHVESDCSCRSIEAPVEEIANMLREGRIPILAVKPAADSDGDPTLLVDGIDLDDADSVNYHCPYFAVTHMWSDGLGNPEGNALPRCQIERLDAIARNLKGTFVELLTEKWNTTAAEMVEFWLDTLCIPVQAENQDLRDFSIQKTHEIYFKAGGVVVLDIDLLSLPKSATPLEVLVRTLCSGWRGRLWTWQEGMLALELRLPGRDCCFIIDPNEDDAEVKGPGLPRDLILFPIESSLRASYQDLINNAATRHDVAQHPERAFRIMLKAITHRTTTRPADETVCIATFLNLNPERLLEAAPQDRMPILLSLLPVPSARILFTWGPRLQAQGFKWAPSTFLAPQGLRDHNAISLPLTYLPATQNVSTPRSSTESIPAPLPYLHPDGKGLMAFFPALSLHKTTERMPEVFSVITREQGTYIVEFIDTGSEVAWADVAPDHTRSMAILLSDLRFGGTCLLVEVEEGAAKSKITHWRSVVRVRSVDDSYVEDARDEVASANTVSGDYVPFTWWVID
ncbi:hypothetical protein LTR08_003575 [Meristemomyces frigidus]|nr:hypothetical protein LTR08_003575 [Meristemomyces frigidus]